MSDKLHPDVRDTNTFRRLHRLTSKGYVARLESYGGVEDAIYLDHLADGPKLLMYPDGKLVAYGGAAPINPLAEEDQDRIYNEDTGDAALFDSFLAGVRQPNWRERSAPAREKYLWTPGCLILFILGSVLVTKFLGDLWNYLTS